MHRKDDFGVHLLSGVDNGFHHLYAGVLTSPSRDLDNEGSLSFNTPAKQAQSLFHVVDVVGANGETAIGNFEKFSRCY